MLAVESCIFVFYFSRKDSYRVNSLWKIFFCFGLPFYSVDALYIYIYIYERGKEGVGILQSRCSFLVYTPGI